MSGDLSHVPISALAKVNPPRSAIEIPLNEAATFIPMSDVSEQGEWINREVRSIKEVLSGFTHFAENDVLFAKITPCMENGKGAHAIGLINGIGFGSTEFHVLRPLGGTHPRYLFHWCQSIQLRREAERFMIGSAGQQRVSPDFFEHFLVPLLSFREQRRIAEILDTVDEAIRQTERVIEKLRQMKQGLLHDLLTRGLDANGQLRDPHRHPEQFKDSPLGRIPREWGIKTVLELSREIVVGIVIRPTQYYVSQGVPVLRSANVEENQLNMESLVYMSEKDHKILSKSAVAPGDLVTVRTGYPGTTAIVPESLPVANTVDIIVTRPDALIVPFFLSTWINSDLGRGQVLRTQGGLAQQHFNVGELKKLLVAVPDPVEQEKISIRIRSSHLRIIKEENTLKKLHTIKQGLMDDLLTGRVRVSNPEEVSA